MDIEVEIRSFISKEKYSELMAFFKKDGKFISDDHQETHYLDENGDVRIQSNQFYSKIWMKKGKLHDEQREEFEIKFGKEDFPKLESLFSHLGYKTHIKWLRNRTTFEWQGISVMVDYTKGYGYIIELEKMSNDVNKDVDLKILKEKLKSLGLEQSSKEEFSKKYADYKENWKSLIS
jgi:predicted adenylyl cyclase CyaB